MATAKKIKSKYLSKKISSNIIKGLLITGTICIAGNSPYFALAIVRYFKKYGLREFKKKENKQLLDSFRYLRKNNLISVEKKNKQIYISLTEQGKKKAKQFQINELEIKKPKKWDKKWRILIFDIPEKTRIKREALRGKLKELGFVKIQKSVWVHPYNCKGEIKMLQDFFGFAPENYLLIETHSLGKINQKIKKGYQIT